MSRVLVTGAAGFIGYHLAAKLAERHDEVVLLDDFSRGERDDAFQRLAARPNVSLVERDLTDPAAIDDIGTGYDAVYHMAAVNGTRTFYDRPWHVLRTNVLSTLWLIEWARTAQPGRVIIASSSEAYAGSVRLGSAPVPTPERVPLTILDPYEARYSYGGSKLTGELLAINGLADTPTGLTIVRYHNVYGPRMGHGHVIDEFCVRAARREDPFEIYGGEQTRAYVYVDDAVADTIALAELAEASGRTVNVGGGAEVSALDLARAVIACAGYTPRIVDHGAPPGSVNRRQADLTLLDELVGPRPRVALEEGLARTYAWYESKAADAPVVAGFSGISPG